MRIIKSKKVHKPKKTLASLHSRAFKGCVKVREGVRCLRWCNIDLAGQKTSLELCFGCISCFTRSMMKIATWTAKRKSVTNEIREVEDDLLDDYNRIVGYVEKRLHRSILFIWYTYWCPCIVLLLPLLRFRFNTKILNWIFP